MPYGKPYGKKEMEGMTKAGEMNPVPDGMLHREPLEGDLIGPTVTSFAQTLDAPTPPGGTDEKAIFALADNNDIYNTAGK